jgi:hypothetical protein
VRALRPCPLRDGEDGAALVAVLIALVLLLPLALGALIIVIQAQKGLVYEKSRTVTAHVAEAGLDAATSALRTASDGGLGVRTALPCADTTPIQGSVGAQASSLRYTVRIRYYVQDPQGQPEIWRTANRLACVAGSGVSTTPFFALLQSSASGSRTAGAFTSLRERSLEAVYRFNVDNKNIGGGLVRTRAQNNLSAVDVCWASSSAAPIAGDGLVMATCDDGSPAQMFTYRSDHTLYNVHGKLCLTTSWLQGAPLTLETCDSAPHQQWIYTGSDHIAAVDVAGTSVLNSCIAMLSAYTLGTPVVLSGDCGSTQSMWSPESRTGPGAAGDATYQLVNFAQFARCFDVTDWNFSNYFMQLHPCKQSPTTFDYPAQQLTYDPASKVLQAGNPGDLLDWCLTAPPPGGGHGEYVTMEHCNGGHHQQWTETGDTGDWATGYTIVDADGRCLAAGPVPPDPGRTFSSIIVAPCDGSTAEKWNAPPELTQAGLQGFRETTNG